MDTIGKRSRFGCRFTSEARSFGAGGWWNVHKFDDITGSVSIEIGSMQYLHAEDNGLFSVGPQHSIGQISAAHF